jgi:hypothetical protein
MSEDKYEGYPPLLKQYFEDHDVLAEYNKLLDEEDEKHG